MYKVLKKEGSKNRDAENNYSGSVPSIEDIPRGKPEESQATREKAHKKHKKKSKKKDKKRSRSKDADASEKVDWVSNGMLVSAA